uniref:NACHT and WD repeat domain-containing protein n=1 Tax=Scytonema sp. HK-05 TaxID=1137095 RepID=UPI0009598CD7
MHVKTILILAANPTNTSRLRLDEEVREIDEGLRRANKREQFNLEQKWAVRSRDFYRAILDYQPQIVHLCGHGAGKDGIVLEDETGQAALIRADALASMFKLFASKGVDCVLLNACYSEVQASAISQHVNYVIGMNNTVGDKAAVAFAVAFYDAMAAGEGVEFAYELGCSQMITFVEQQTPVLRKKELITVTTQPETEVIPPNPYQGLSAFGEEDAAFFFGRETFVNGLVQAVQKQPLVAVIGPSGSGKSSVVLAGLISQLREQGSWLIESFRPGNQPFYQLASALVSQLEPKMGDTQQLREAAGLAADMQQGKVTLQQVVSRITERNPDKRLLLFADQFEELYTLCQVKEEQERFADTLLEAIHQKSLTLVFTLRADFYGYVLSYRPLRDALHEFTPQLLSSMNQEELQAAIQQPAQKLEVQLEDGLTQRILDDVGQEPGNLPLLEFALTRLWEKQENRELTHQAYDEIGGVKKAIANHAEQIYQQLSEAQQKQAQRIFLQLVRPGEGTEDTRRLATRAEVGQDNWGLVSYLAGYQARLVVTGRHEQEDTVEVVHEALIREWGTLREWINANRQFRVWQERLKVALREWKNSNHDSGALLRGVPLTVAEDWLHKRADEMTQEERDFIQASAQQRDKEKQELERSRRLAIIVLGSFSVVALSLAGIAGVGWWSAAISQINSLTNTSDALLNSNGREAVKTSLKAVVQMEGTPWVGANTRTQVELGLMHTVHNVAAPNTLGGHAKQVNGVSFSPDGKMLASASADNTVKLWDTSTGKQIKTLTGHT